MAIITFWNEQKKQTGKTMSTVAIATYMAIEHNARILIVSTDSNQEKLQRCFWKEEKKKKINFGIFGPNTRTLDAEIGMKGLDRIIKSNKITPEIITDYTRVVFKDRLEILLGTGSVNPELAQRYPDVIAAANKYYDRILVDLDYCVPEETRKIILDMSDVVILNLAQGLSDIEKFRQKKEQKTDALIQSPKTLLLVGNYDKDSKYNYKNITRYLKERNQVLTVPYNTLFFEASEEGMVADLFLQFAKYSNSNKEDQNTFFIEEVKRATDNIVYRLVN